MIIFGECVCERIEWILQGQSLSLGLCFDIRIQYASDKIHAVEIVEYADPSTAMPPPSTDCDWSPEFQQHRLDTYESRAAAGLPLFQHGKQARRLS